MRKTLGRRRGLSWHIPEMRVDTDCSLLTCKVWHSLMMFISSSIHIWSNPTITLETPKGSNWLRRSAFAEGENFYPHSGLSPSHSIRNRCGAKVGLLLSWGRSVPSPSGNDFTWLSWFPTESHRCHLGASGSEGASLSQEDMPSLLFSPGTLIPFF